VSHAQQQEPAAGPSWVRHLAFSPDGAVLGAAGANNTTQGELVAWDVASWEPRWRRSEAVGFPCVAFSPDGKMLAVSRFAPETQLLNPATGEVLGELKGHTGHARCVTFTPDGQQIITGSYDRSIKIWDAASGTELATLAGHESAVYSVAVSPDGTLLACADARAYKVHLWDLTSRELVFTSERMRSLVPHVCFSPDGRWLAAPSWAGGMSVYDTKSRSLWMKMHAGVGPGLGHAAYSPDQQWLAVAGTNGTLYIHPVHSAPDPRTTDTVVSLLARFQEDSYEVREQAERDLAAIGFAAEQQLREAMQSTSPEVRWRARRLRQRLEGAEAAVQLRHGEHIECVTFSPDGRLLASGDRLGEVKVWSVGDWQPLVSLSAARP
jgi:WD40 repeat protein